MKIHTTSDETRHILYFLAFILLIIAFFGTIAIVAKFPVLLDPILKIGKMFGELLTILIVPKP